MQIRFVKRSIEISTLVCILSVLTFAGCGGGGGGTSSGGVTYSAQAFFKATRGDTWTLSKSSVDYNSSGVVVNTSNSEVTSLITSLVNGVATGTEVSVSNGITGSSLTFMRRIDASGNLVHGNPNGLSVVLLPATFSVGTSWTYQAASGTGSAATATITGLNVSHTVPAGTFSDCIQISISEFQSPYSTMNSGTIFFSPSVGTVIESNLIIKTMAGVLSSTITTQLKPGYSVH